MTTLQSLLCVAITFLFFNFFGVFLPSDWLLLEFLRLRLIWTPSSLSLSEVSWLLTSIECHD